MDDVLRIILPLFEQVQAVHETGKVAPLEGTSHLVINEAGCLGFLPEKVLEPKMNWLRSFGETLASATHGDGVEIVAERRQVTDLSDEQIRVQNEELTENEAKINPPKYLQSYVSWEHQVGQHDPVTDIFSLGLLLASVACGLDLTNEDDFQIFVAHRAYLQAGNS